LFVIMGKLFDAKGKRIIGAGAALASVVLALSLGSTPARADWRWDGHGRRVWIDRGYYNHPRYYGSPHYYGGYPRYYGPPVVYGPPVYAPPPPVYYGYAAPGINVTIPLR
jgi:hypothetical protein